MGGSAVAMASQIADGYALVSAVQLKRLTDAELPQLQFELEKLLREARGEVVPVEDQPAMQARNRRITRLTGALRQIQATVAQRKRAV